MWHYCRVISHYASLHDDATVTLAATSSTEQPLIIAIKLHIIQFIFTQFRKKEFLYYFTLLKNYSKCHIWIFDFWYFPPIFVLFSHYSKSQTFVQKFNFEKTPTLSRVFELIFFWQFFSWNQSCQQLKCPKPQRFHEFFTQKKIDNFLGKSNLKDSTGLNLEFFEFGIFRVLQRVFLKLRNVELTPWVVVLLVETSRARLGNGRRFSWALSSDSGSASFRRLKSCRINSRLRCESRIPAELENECFKFVKFKIQEENKVNWKDRFRVSWRWIER